MSTIPLLRAQFEKTLRPLYHHVIGGQTVLPVPGGQTLAVECKYSGKRSTAVTLASDAQTAAAVDAAVGAVGAMRATKRHARKEALLRVAGGILAREDELVGAICWEVGKPVRDARVEVARAVDTFTLAAEEAVRPQGGDFLPLDNSPRNAPYSMVASFFPVGAVAMISPFNFPVNLVAHKVAPALAAGCPFVLKPSERTPLGAFLLAEILQQHTAGLLPPGALSVVLPESVAASQRLVTDPRLACLSFTGSPAVGWRLRALAGRKRVLLELGGNAAAVVDEHADLAAAAERLLFGAFYSGGQSCISVQRIYVHRSRLQALRALLVEGTARLSAQRGDPFDPATFLGPLVAPAEVQRALGMLREAQREDPGVTVLSGGTGQGGFMDCTLVEGAGDASVLNRGEVFAPLCTLQPYDTFQEAIARVNDSEFGLQAGVFTNDINRAFYAYEHLDVGGVVINDIPSVRVDSQPYGGVKASGVGREGVRDCIQEFSEKKVMLFKNLGQLPENN